MPPDWLSEDALAVWNSLAPELERLGLLTVLDVQLFSVFCNASAEFTRLARIISEADELVVERGQHGYRQEIPEISLQRRFGDTMRRIGARFGLDPVARSGLDVLPGNIGSASTEPEDEDTTERDGVLDLVERRLRRVKK